MDLDKARILTTGVAVLESDQARRRVISRVLPVAAGKTHGQLRWLVEREVIRADPAAAKTRHREKVRRRGYDISPEIDSVADLSLFNIPADKAKEIFARIDAIARWHKAQGDPRMLNQLRGDVAVSMLDGSGMMRDEYDPDIDGPGAPDIPG